MYHTISRWVRFANIYWYFDPFVFYRRINTVTRLYNALSESNSKVEYYFPCIFMYYLTELKDWNIGAHYITSADDNGKSIIQSCRCIDSSINDKWIKISVYIGKPDPSTNSVIHNICMILRQWTLCYWSIPRIKNYPDETWHCKLCWL